MTSARLKEEISVMEAMDQLSKMAELDLLSTDNQRLATDKEAAQWLDPRYADQQRETIKKTFRVLLNYLLHLWEKERVQLKDVGTQRGIQAMMLLVGEAAEKVDRFTPLFAGVHGGESIVDLKEYQELQEFYRTRVVKKIPKFMEDLQTQESENEEGFKRIATVNSDQNYELFTLKNQEGKPFFHHSLLRHMLLIGEFDETFTALEGEEVFNKIKEIADEEAHLSAKEILKGAEIQLHSFYKEALQHKAREWVSALNKATIALMLAADSRNRMVNLREKSCVHYFADFQRFLRIALCTEEYIKQVSVKHLEMFEQVLIRLSHAFCEGIVMRAPSRKYHMELLRRLVRKERHTETGSIVDHALTEERQLSAYFKRYPHGPLLKILDALRLKESGFDPFSQGNLPFQLFKATCSKNEVSVLHLPTPTHQESVDTAMVTEEFKGFLRSARSTGRKCHMLVNLQNRNAWEEAARSRALEKMQHEEEFAPHLKVVTLAKGSAFYLQEGEWASRAQPFMHQLQEQLFEGESFYLPPDIKTENTKQFVSRVLPLIHQLFFASKEELSKENRQDFIEIFYQLFVLKLIEVLDADTLSFTCKDGIDTGAAASASFYVLMRLINHPAPLTAQEQDLFRFLVHGPALMLRERSIAHDRFVRCMGCIAALCRADHQHMKHIISKVLDGISVRL